MKCRPIAVIVLLTILLILALPVWAEEPAEPGFPVVGFYLPLILFAVLGVCAVLIGVLLTVAIILYVKKKKK